MAGLPVSVCFWDYDRTLPLARGEVAIAGCEANFHILRPEAMFARAFSTAEFDVTELSFSNHVSALAAGRAAYTALPVFPSRSFRHQAIYVRTDRGIATPQDLKGRVMGLQEYDMTAALVVRGMLRDQYGLAPSDLRWRVGDVETRVREHLDVPDVAGVHIEATDEPLSALLARGEIDALIALDAPSCFRAGEAGVGRLFPDWRRAERAYYETTGLFPIMHMVGVRTRLLDAHPWLARAVHEAFEEAKKLAVARLGVTQALKATLPWLAAELAETRALMGEDYWPYGIEANRRVLETQLGWHQGEGLSPRLVKVEELFAADTIDS